MTEGSDGSIGELQRSEKEKEEEIERKKMENENEVRKPKHHTKNTILTLTHPILDFESTPAPKDWNWMRSIIEMEMENRGKTKLLGKKKKY